MSSDTTPPDRCMTVRELAKWLRKRRAAVERLVETGVIAAFNVGGSIRITPEAIRAFLQKNQATSPPKLRRQRRPVEEWY